jgi:hypothetical protein
MVQVEALLGGAHNPLVFTQTGGLGNVKAQRSKSSDEFRSKMIGYHSVARGN